MRIRADWRVRGPHEDATEQGVASGWLHELRFEPGVNTADPDERVLSDEDLERAAEEGKTAEQAQG
jgi:hypothetical protein